MQVVPDDDAVNADVEVLTSELLICPLRQAYLFAEGGRALLDTLQGYRQRASPPGQ